MKREPMNEAWLDYKTEWYPGENRDEIISPVAAAFEAGWMAAGEEKHAVGAMALELGVDDDEGWGGPFGH
jgi:hypothetical protein